MLAVQKFAQELLEVADNLESAAKAVPSNIVQQGADVPAETALKYLRSLLEGVQATERVLLKVGPAAAQAVREAAGRSICSAGDLQSRPQATCAAAISTYNVLLPLCGCAHQPAWCNPPIGSMSGNKHCAGIKGSLLSSSGCTEPLLLTAAVDA